jgi:hypothetical protein
MPPARLAARGAARPVRWAAPPVLAWVAASLISWWVARASHVAYWSTAGRERWDSEHYLSISRSGYEMFRCWDRPGYKDAGFRDVVCGNVAWYPGYPVAVRAVAATGLSYDVAAVVVSETALLGMFAVLWWLLGGRLTWATGLTLAIGAVFPGGIYFHAVFPIALGTLALLVAIAGIRRGSWILAAAGGLVAAACHPVGGVVVGMLVLSAFFAWKQDAVKVRIAKALGSATIAGSGVLWAKWLMWKNTGHWDAYEQIQRSSYSQGGLHDPFTEARASYDYPFKQLYFHAGDKAGWLVEHSLAAHRTQLWLNVAFVVAVVAATGWRLVRERRLAPEEWAALLLTGAIFAVPFFAGAVNSWYRNHAQLFVALVLVAKLPRWIQVPLLIACAVQYALLGAMFFAGVLV